jgi:hypothetical protein
LKFFTSFPCGKNPPDDEYTKGRDYSAPRILAGAKAGLASAERSAKAARIQFIPPHAGMKAQGKPHATPRHSEDCYC